MTLKPSAARVLADGHSVDTLRVYVQSPRGDFTMEFAVDARFDDFPVWNVASNPPRELGTADDDYEAIQRSENNYVIPSDAESAQDVVDEAMELKEVIGGSDAYAYRHKTFKRVKGLPWYLTKSGWAKRGHDLLAGGGA